MDESWRMRMGMATKPNLPRRKSTEETSRRPVFADSEILETCDFNDVFGGPPRTVLSRQFSGDFARSTLFYDEIFRHPEKLAPARGGRNLPEFRIPESRKIEGFYDDIFGSEGDDRRSRSRSRTNSKAKSKSNSSSVLSSEDLSPRRPDIVGDDGSFSSFASKLRPINVPSRWNSSTTIPKEKPIQQGMPAFSCNQFAENDYTDNFRSFHFGFSKHVSSPETISLDPNSYGSVKVSMDDLELNSPSSVISSLCQDSEVKFNKVNDKVLEEQDMEEQEDDDDEVMSSYVIEINSDHREGTGEALGVDEAIAWAKERFQTQSPEKDCSVRQHEKETIKEEMSFAHGFSEGKLDGHGSMHCAEAAEEENLKLEKNIEMELLDEDIRMWSSGKEANIRLLLSTLHHVLWPNSGWCAISLTNLIESSHVKKAYQKARLCLHPDKLQQRGATIQQKYVAEKAFSILQDAWAAFITQDVFVARESVL